MSAVDESNDDFQVIVGSNLNAKHWLRNFDNNSHSGFWLPTSPRKFFCYFIVELFDGTILIVECTNAKLASKPAEQHKRNNDELWEHRFLDGYRFAWLVEGYSNR